jgi:hypothetical protein
VIKTTKLPFSLTTRVFYIRRRTTQKKKNPEKNWKSSSTAAEHSTPAPARRKKSKKKKGSSRKKDTVHLKIILEIVWILDTTWLSQMMLRFGTVIAFASILLLAPEHRSARTGGSPQQVRPLIFLQSFDFSS